MSEPFLAEIRIWGCNFAPRGWAFCNGQIMPIAQNTALFSLVGTTYGGNGTTTFALPDLRGRAPMHPGNGNGLTPRSLGESIGAPSITLNEAEMPQHTHTANANQGNADVSDPTGQMLSRERAQPPQFVYKDALTNPVSLSPTAISATGGSQPHLNMQPYVALNFTICLQGIFPSRN